MLVEFDELHFVDVHRGPIDCAAATPGWHSTAARTIDFTESVDADRAAAGNADQHGAECRRTGQVPESSGSSDRMSA